MGMEEEKNKVVVQTKGIAKISDFYIVDPRKNQVKKLSRVFVWNHSLGDGLIGDGSVIYTIGTDPDDTFFIKRGFSKNYEYHVHSLDLEDPQGSWKDIGGILNCAMSYPSCASLGDNIFFFGAHSANPPSSWSIGEFYDKNNACWQPIPIPLSGINDHKVYIDRPIISDPKHNRLLVFIDILRSLYAYYPENRQWVCFDDKTFSSWPGQPVPSPVDDIIFFIRSNCLTAYDVLSKNFLEVSWSSSCSHILDQSPSMLHLGGNNLCFTTTQFGKNSFWEYYRFQVARFSHQNVLLTPLSVHRFPVPAQGHESQLNAIAL